MTRSLRHVLLLSCVVVLTCAGVHTAVARQTTIGGDGGGGSGIQTTSPAMPGPYEIGRQTQIYIDPSRQGGRVIKTDVWYPLAAGAFFTPFSIYEIGTDEPQIFPSTITSSRAHISTQVAPGVFPLIVYTHGDGAWRYCDSFLCEQLASWGFIVAAPDHAGDTTTDYVNGTLYGIDQNAYHQPLDVSFVITTMLNRSNTPGDILQGRINAEKIGVIGWSFGGFTTMTMPLGYANSNPPVSPDTRVKALMTLCGSIYTISSDQLATVSIPTLVMSGNADSLQYYSDTIFQNVPNSYLVRIRGAWHESFMDRCDNYRNLLAQGVDPVTLSRLYFYPNDVCPPDLIDADDVHNLVNLYGVAFFLSNLSGDHTFDNVLTRGYAKANYAGTVEYHDHSITDRNGNGVDDSIDIATGASADADHDGIPDESEVYRLYVDANATGRNWGTSWKDAYTDLGQALYVAAFKPQSPPVDIWVATGVYHPRSNYTINGPDKLASFRFVPNVRLFGGFAGGETDLAQRNWKDNPTILSGDLLDNDGPNFANTGDNCYIVLSGNAFSAPGIVDGFTISGGNATGNEVFWGGGGASSLTGNLPDFYHCTFTANQANAGGAICASVGDDPFFVDCLIDDNRSLSSPRNVGGGGIAAFTSSTPTFINCTVVNNAAQDNGGGLMSEYAANPTVENCIFWGNTSADDDQLRVENFGGGEPASFLHILRSDIQNGLAGVTVADIGTLYYDPSNISANPLFTSTDPVMPFGLQVGSPCVDRGNPSYVPDWDDADAAGDPRVVDGDGNRIAVVDLGAFELTPPSCPSDVNGDGVVNTADLSSLLRHFGFGTVPAFTEGDANGDGIINSYDLSSMLRTFGGSCP